MIYSWPRNLAGKLLNEPGMPPRECIVVRVQQEASRLWNRLSWKFSWDNNSTISIQQFIKQTICHAKLQKQLGSSGSVAHVLRWFLRLWVGGVGTIMARSQKAVGHSQLLECTYIQCCVASSWSCRSTMLISHVFMPGINYCRCKGALQYHLKRCGATAKNIVLNYSISTRALCCLLRRRSAMLEQCWWKRRLFADNIVHI